MSQRRYRKDLDFFESVASLTDHELREALKKYNESPGPITDSTRNLYRKKLASLMEKSGTDMEPNQGPNVSLQSKKSPTIADIPEDDSDTSDEDYIAQEEEDEESTSDGSDEEEDEDEELTDEFDEENVKLSTSTTSDNLTNSVLLGPDAAPNRISRGILMLLLSFFVAIFSFYLYSSNFKLFVPSQPLKSITKQMLILLALSPIGFAIYRTVRYYQQRARQENQRVCELVSEALELLQSPDNPKGLMPILHIRDTLLTPAERKAKKRIILWNKAVKFIEDHESRVKVELVNIDGEDFRAWKWIGNRKL